MLAIDSLASESDVFVGMFVGTLVGSRHSLGFQNFVPEIIFLKSPGRCK